MCGSGTTCKMAKVHSRKYLGIDISAEYCQLAIERIKAAQAGMFLIPKKIKNVFSGNPLLFEAN